MQWLQTLDSDLFRFVNQTLINRYFDQLMPFASGNPYFYPTLVILGILLIWKGGSRGLLCVLMVALIVPSADGLCTLLKNAVGRDRPFLALHDVHLLVGRGGSHSMPSGHATNCFAAAMVAFLYYRRSAWLMLPLAILVSFSRVYNGVHYPGDVLAGAALGSGFAVAALWLLDAIWRWAGSKWFPLWWSQLPSLVVLRSRSESGAEELEEPFRPPAVRGQAPQGFRAPHVSMDEHWLRLGYVCIAALLCARLGYIGSRIIQLSEDEAYQWVWSKHLALSYYSKPPLIAYTQFLGTSLWGDNAFGVRFFSPVLTALMSVFLLRFFAREVNARAGFLLLLMATTTPLISAGAVLMTVDPLSVFFWTAAMLSGWKAIQEKGRTTDWLWTGLWMGLGFLSKYTALFQFLCWVVLFALWPPARKQLKRPGPYLAVLITAICSLPVLIWNSQHHWITVTHVAENASVGTKWHPTLKFFVEFVGSEVGLLNPVFFIAMVWAAIAFWKRGRRNPHLVYFFCMGAPVFLAYLAHSLRARALPNWIAPSVIPLLCLAVVYWDTQARLGVPWVKSWLNVGVILGGVMVLLFHDTNLVKRLTAHYVPLKLDPLHRVREWDKVALAADGARQRLMSEGKPVFIIGDSYGITGEISFYLREAKAKIKSDPIVYYLSSDKPENQFYFWPGYSSRKGENAVFIRELDRDNPTPFPPPDRLQQEFESVTDMGVTNVMYHDVYLLRPFQIFACRGVR